MVTIILYEFILITGKVFVLEPLKYNCPWTMET